MTAEQLQQDLVSAYGGLIERRRRRGRRLRAAAIAVSALFVLTGAAFGISVLLGWPAPEHVKRELAAVDQGMPEDLRLNPDVEHAVAVAATDTATLYAATLRGGGSCSEIVTADDRGRGATCTTSAQYVARPIEITLPFDEGETPETAVVVGGRINEKTATRLEIAYADGSSEPVPLGDDRYYLFDVPAAQLASVHEDGFELVARNGDGAVVARGSVPGSWDDPAKPDQEAPIYVSTHSDSSDFTKVYGLDGYVGAEGATSLQLDYGDGTTVSIPIRDDRSYEYTVPAERVDDFMQPRTLEALGADGKVVASTSVAAVAYWHGRERGLP
jgi:hypothetical protein